VARNTSFLALLTRLKEETGRSAETNVGVDDEDTLKTTLNRWYESLWYTYDWPHLRKDFSVPLVAGDYQYDMPSGLDLERIEKVSLKYNSIWRPILRGIDFEDYNTFDPASGDRADPVLKTPAELREGHVIIPARPGTGIEWNESAVEKYRI